MTPHITADSVASDQDSFRLNREITSSTQGAAPTPPRTVAAPCHPAHSKRHEVTSS
ncbi:hypothetical protein Acor_83350 [Acrocarpospora corrugata]|uniref:Uncharacterized protein n=1 Tax=Acrocarpospora corrugata TaxID=35763 RepID=A0A5M3WBR0_9ACTN|nr:hypothetical protein [Acrocarpospora corrugata]GES06266.1 hypothetical protein Acor_83350 [Acrocarpospora corrugata]